MKNTRCGYLKLDENDVICSEMLPENQISLNLCFIESILIPLKFVICSKTNPKLDRVPTTDFAIYMEFVIISNRKTLLSRFSNLLSVLQFIFNHFQTSKILQILSGWLLS